MFRADACDRPGRPRQLIIRRQGDITNESALRFSRKSRKGGGGGEGGGERGGGEG